MGSVSLHPYVRGIPDLSPSSSLGHCRQWSITYGTPLFIQVSNRKREGH
uniref:Uncharacterized protein n=1 Tax=Utricularia reniformis TaxID=192314 RepID=A0A1Y0B406_9LAMI|nr:hypothetical protein AEK19_MT1961 [Utricularia reniformis]ART32124.1 hypothetical protein AEK19_MT1961 [Utricularia reniformis]